MCGNWIQFPFEPQQHRIYTGPEVSLRRYFVRNFTSADVKIRHHMTPSWSAHGSFSQENIGTKCRVHSRMASQHVKKFRTFSFSQNTQKCPFWSGIYSAVVAFAGDVCSASTLTSLQGLDYFSAEGGKAFDDMVTVVDKLGDVYELGLTWSKEQIRKLKLAKRYFKSDYKVSDLLNNFLLDEMP